MDISAKDFADVEFMLRELKNALDLCPDYDLDENPSLEPLARLYSEVQSSILTFEESMKTPVILVGDSALAREVGKNLFAISRRNSVIARNGSSISTASPYHQVWLLPGWQDVPGAEEALKAAEYSDVVVLSLEVVNG